MHGQRSASVNRSFLSPRRPIRKLLVSPANKIGGRMHSRLKLNVCLLGIAALFVAAEVPARAQDQQHVVSLSDLNKDASRPAQTRQANEQAVRTLLSSEQGQKALQSAKLDYQKVDKAVGQLSDEDLDKLAERSRQAQ